MRLLLALAVLAAGCGDAPSSKQCSESLDHLIDLEVLSAGGNKGLTEEMKADLAKQKTQVADLQRQQFMDACVKKTPKSVVSCTIKAQTLEEAGKCDH